VLGKELREQHQLGMVLPNAGTIVVDARAKRLLAAEDRRPRRAAERRRAMSVGEDHATLCKPIQLGRLDLRMPLQEPHPVIEIIDGNEEHVGPARLL